MFHTAVVVTGLVVLGQVGQPGPEFVRQTIDPSLAAGYAFADAAQGPATNAPRQTVTPTHLDSLHRRGSLLQAMLQEEPSGARTEERLPGDPLVPEPPSSGAGEMLVPAPPTRPSEPMSAEPESLPGRPLPGVGELPGEAQAGDVPPAYPDAEAGDLPPGLLPADPAYEAGAADKAPGSPFVLEQPGPVVKAPGESCGNGAWCEPAQGCGSCACGSGCGVGAGAAGWLDSILYEGWLQQGVTINTLSPRNRSNFPVGFNEGSNEYLLNQLYLLLERPVAEGRTWDVGGRVDFMYGTDWTYVGARGLELHDDGSPRWSSDQYGPAMPQLYAKVHTPWLGGMDFKLGRFYTLLGYETVPAVDNFFYSHSYHLLYGEPFTHTGLLGSWPVGRLTLHAGMTRGWDAWEDNNNDLAFLGGAEWLSADERWKVVFAIHSGPEQDEPPRSLGTRTIYSLVVSCQVTDRLLYVIQHDQGVDENARLAGTRDANWYGINQYLIYQINPQWQSGLRLEWFRDEDGFRVNPGVAASYYELSFGVKYEPYQRVICRSELRWDWANGDLPGYRPFGDGTEMHQVLVDFDLILRF